MRRVLGSLMLGTCLLLVAPATAHADITAFLGFSPTPATRSTGGVALGVSLVVVGFEFEYAHTTEDPLSKAPGLRTGMVNALVQTPTSAQVYVTAGGGFFSETLGTASENSFGTNIGGGIKLGLVGPLRLRVDYRIFHLHGAPLYSTPQRFYAGANVSF
jgi:hypothetical protein